MKTLRFYIFLSLSPLLLTYCGAVKRDEPTAQSQPKPNIVIINVDDLGWRDLGFMGSPYYESPNLDRLASEGMVFTQAYAAAANCAPSRACLMSGLNTPRHGIYTVENSDRGYENINPQSFHNQIKSTVSPYPLATDNIRRNQKRRAGLGHPNPASFFYKTH